MPREINIINAELDAVRVASQNLIRDNLHFTPAFNSLVTQYKSLRLEQRDALDPVRFHFVQVPGDAPSAIFSIDSISV